MSSSCQVTSCRLRSLYLGCRQVNATRRLLALDTPPQAIFAQNDLMTMGVWRALHTHPIGTDLVGFDDFALADVLQPPVNVVAQNPVELGRQAAALLFDRLDRPDRASRRVVLPTRLVTRS